MKYCCCILLLFLFACKAEKKTVGVDVAAARFQLLSTDSAFSAMSEREGMKQAFMQFMDEDGILLRANNKPLAGAEAIDFLLQQIDTNYNMTWQPRHAAVSASADMGYTYGLYKLQPHSVDTLLYGTYVSIWKKQKDSSWKFVLESSNDGIGLMNALPPTP